MTQQDMVVFWQVDTITKQDAIDHLRAIMTKWRLDGELLDVRLRPDGKMDFTFAVPDHDRQAFWQVISQPIGWKEQP